MNLAARIGVVAFGEDCVRLAIVKTGGKLPVLCEEHTEPIVPTDSGDRSSSLVSAIKQILLKVKPKPNSYVLCADARFCVVRPLMVPFKGKSKVAAAVRFELEPYLAFPIEELVTDHCIIREVDGQTEVLAVGIRKGLLEESLGALLEAGIDPDGIGLDVAGLTALWQCGRQNVKGLNAVLHVLDSGAFLVVVQEKTLCFFRHLPLSPETLQNDPRTGAREVMNTLRSFLASRKTDETFESLTVTGFEFEESSREIFESHVALPVTYADLMQSVRLQVPKRKREEAEEDQGVSAEHRNTWASLVGVALGACGAFPSFNFRQGDLAQKQAWRHVLLQGIFTSVLAAVLLVSYGFFCYIDYRRNQAEIERIGAEIWDLFSKTFPTAETAKKRPSQDIGGVLTFKFMDEEFKKSAGVGRGFSPELLTRPTLLDILAEITGTLSPEKVLLTDLVVRSSNTRSQPVTLIGELKDPGAIAQEFEKLKQSKLLKVTGEPTVSSKPDKTTFTIVASTQ